jgi:uncharacterized protein (DUF433 family)
MSLPLGNLEVATFKLRAGLRSGASGSPPLRDMQIAARHADPRTPTTTVDDQRRQNDDRHAAYAVVASVSNGCLSWSGARPALEGSSGSGSSVVVRDTAALIEMRDVVRGGKPCFVGTRIAVYDVLEYLAGGMTAEDIVADFPELTDAHVPAALEFAARRERRLAESA